MIIMHKLTLKKEFLDVTISADNLMSFH